MFSSFLIVFPRIRLSCRSLRIYFRGREPNLRGRTDDLMRPKLAVSLRVVGYFVNMDSHRCVMQFLVTCLIQHRPLAEHISCGPSPLLTLSQNPALQRFPGHAVNIPVNAHLEQVLPTKQKTKMIIIIRVSRTGLLSLGRRQGAPSPQRRPSAAAHSSLRTRRHSTPTSSLPQETE